MKKLFSIAWILLFTFHIVYAQSEQDRKNLIISASLGFPEYLDIGLRHEALQSKVGIGYGFMPRETYRYISCDAYFHIAGTSKLSSRQPLYIKFGICHVREDDGYDKENYVALNMRIGREFNISRHFGISCELGPKINLYVDEVPKTHRSSMDDFMDDFLDIFSTKLWIGSSVSMFFRI